MCLDILSWIGIIPLKMQLSFKIFPGNTRKEIFKGHTRDVFYAFIMGIATAADFLITYLMIEVYTWFILDLLKVIPFWCIILKAWRLCIVNNSMIIIVGIVWELGRRLQYRTNQSNSILRRSRNVVSSTSSYHSCTNNDNIVAILFWAISKWLVNCFN